MCGRSLAAWELREDIERWEQERGRDKLLLLIPVDLVNFGSTGCHRMDESALTLCCHRSQEHLTLMTRSNMRSKLLVTALLEVGV
jgi:hypothetical protein